MKKIVIKVFEVEVDSIYENLDESKMKLLSHQEFEFAYNTTRSVQMLFARLARFVEDKRDQPATRGLVKSVKSLRTVGKGGLR